MTNSQIERDNRLIRYLLGETTGKEQEALEDAYFSDDALYEELEATEAALIDAYVRGQIPEDIRRRFEERYLASPRQRERVEFAKLLLEKTSAAPSEVAQEKIPWWQRIWLSFNSPRRLLISAAALLVLAIVLTGSLLLYRSGRPEPSLAQRDQQALPEGQRPGGMPRAEKSSRPVASPPADDVIALSLVPGLTRGEAPGNVLRIPPSAKLVRLRLEYEGETYQTYRLLVRSPEGREVLRRSELKPMQPGAKTVMVTIPASTLTPGDYIVTLSGSTSAGAKEDLADYFFRVAVK